MVSVQQAEEIMRKVPAPVHTISIPISEAVNRVLAEPIVADRDLPPYHRVAMDGYAIDSRHFSPAKAYAVSGVQAAGSEPLVLASADACIEVMTGAVLPGGADAVIPYEWGETDGNTFKPGPHVKITPWMNIHAQGTDARQGDVLLQPGAVISPAEVAVMASVGKAWVKVWAFPSAALVSTGNEVVPVQVTPQPHQIRQSNVVALQAAMHQMGWEATLHHLPDDYNHMYTAIAALLQQHDVLIFSGGVSKGKFDYLPRILHELQVEKRFHQVAQKPGKPFWFGCRQDGKVVFALPGNPVSTFLCFYRYIRPWILRAMQVDLPEWWAELTSEVRFEPPLTCFLQAEVFSRQGKLCARPVAGHGSGDFVNLKNVHGFLELPAHESVFSAGRALAFIPFRPLY